MANPKIQLRHDTSTNWQTQNPVLLEGEVAIETDSNKVKIGNGTDNYNTLPYITDQTKIDLDYSNADYQPVNKSGDTMTGSLNIHDGNTSIVNTSFDSTTTTAPSEFINLGRFAIFDANTKFTGYLENSFNTNNIVATNVGARRIIGGVNKTATLDLYVDAAGVASCSFSNTTCVDGQYVNTNTTIATNVSVNGSSPLVYTLNLPDDNHRYIVWITVQANTGATSGNYVLAQISSDHSSGLVAARAVTRTTSNAQAGGSICIVVSPTHNIYLNRNTGWNGTVSLSMVGYRRMGTNA